MGVWDEKLQSYQYMVAITVTTIITGLSLIWKITYINFYLQDKNGTSEVLSTITIPMLQLEEITLDASVKYNGDIELVTTIKNISLFGRTSNGERYVYYLNIFCPSLLSQIHQLVFTIVIYIYTRI